MSISHHLSDVTLQDYAAGALETSMEVVIACHLTMCNACLSRSGMADVLGGIIMNKLDYSAPHVSAMELLSRESEVTKQFETPSPVRPAADLPTGVPRPLARLLPCELTDLDWKRLAPGIKQFNLGSKSRKKGAFKLLHLSPGALLSEHTHQDRELTLVLQGSYQDEIGRFKQGDVADLDDEILHQPVVDTHEPCIALIATLSPVRYSGVISRLMQPFIGI